MGGAMTGGATTGGMVGTGSMGGDGGGAVVDAAQGGVVATGGSVGTGGAISTGGVVACTSPAVNLSGADAVDGKLIQFNDDGGWQWFQDERAIVDVKGGKLIVGSVAFHGARNGNIEAVSYDLSTGAVGAPAKLGNLAPDDFNAPAFVLRPDGGYVAMWAGHNENCNTYVSVYNGVAWSSPKTFDWTSYGCPAPTGRMVTFANPWYLGTDLVNFVRSAEMSPNYLVSKDDGVTWSYGGRLATSESGFLAGSFKYWGNNTDRLDFVATEGHPRDVNNSLYHGYIKDGKIYNSTGTVIDATLGDTGAMSITKYTKLFATGSLVGPVKISNAWNSDLVRYQDGTLGLIWTGRVGSVSNSDSNTDLRLLYGRFDGTTWKLTYLAKAGAKLYADEQDYTGLGALVPDDPSTIYISTPYDPNTDTQKSGAKHEIWRGTTCDNGGTFTWTPVTANSTKDNLRPVVPKWDASHRALLWMKGTVTTASTISTRIVGTITGP